MSQRIVLAAWHVERRAECAVPWGVGLCAVLKVMPLSVQGATPCPLYPTEQHPTSTLNANRPHSCCPSFLSASGLPHLQEFPPPSYAPPVHPENSSPLQWSLHSGAGAKPSELIHQAGFRHRLMAMQCSRSAPWASSNPCSCRTHKIPYIYLLKSKMRCHVPSLAPISLRGEKILLICIQSRGGQLCGANSGPVPDPQQLSAIPTLLPPVSLCSFCSLPLSTPFPPLTVRCSSGSGSGWIPSWAESTGKLHALPGQSAVQLSLHGPARATLPCVVLCDLEGYRAQAASHSKGRGRGRGRDWGELG